MHILTWHILIQCLLGYENKITLSPFGITESKQIHKFDILYREKVSLSSDTLKLKDNPVYIGLNYVVAGSFLIPKNADTQVAKLKSLGFSKSFRFNFPESEYYSAVVDTFRLDTLVIPAALIEVTDKLRKNNIDYFLKN
jgi:hypothetical protein